METDKHSSVFGILDGTEVREYHLDNGCLRCSVLDYGCILRTLFVPDRDGNPVDVVLGYDDISQYATFSGRMGAVIGRCANRIKDGRFSIDGREYQLTKNRGEHHIHGGTKGFDKKLWKVLEHDRLHILLAYTSPDGDEGYPGRMNAMVEYRLSSFSLTIRYSAVSDADTVCNLTNHSYFNLAGKGSINDHRVMIHADAYAPVDVEGIPTGVIEKIPEGSSLDWSSTIGDKRFDTDYILKSGSEAAVCGCDSTGIRMQVSTDMPAMQFYTGDGLKETVGKNGTHIGPRSGMCFETQFPVDTPNNPSFGDCILRKSQVYNRETRFTFFSV